MKKLLKFKKGSYVIGGKLSIYPASEPMEEYDLTNLTKEEFKKLKDKPEDKELFKKIKEKRIK